MDGDLSAGSNGEPWYAQFDPRKLWHEREKTVRLNTKTIRVDPSQVGVEGDLASRLEAEGLSDDVVSVVKIK
ncbi:hypothetical protein [Celeribacter litoreus]|uniref:hypothetical protein n=1 Tax=Celeribacter litoreus TaxID=2876714 RepID=UPI001CCBB5F8|nr:hypothetical protein [Celeribacter litoreus]